MWIEGKSDVKICARDGNSQRKCSHEMILNPEFSSLIFVGEKYPT